MNFQPSTALFIFMPIPSYALNRRTLQNNQAFLGYSQLLMTPKLL